MSRPDDLAGWTPEADARIPRGRLAGFVFLFFTMLGFANAAQLYVAGAAAGAAPGVVEALVLSVPFWWVKAALVPAVVFLAWRFSPLGPGWWWKAPLHLGSGFVFAALPLVLGGAVIVAAYPTKGPLSSALASLFSSFFVAGVSIYLLLVGAALGLRYYERSRFDQIRAARLDARRAALEGQLTAARLDALRAQVNPHFLFNVLNSVSVLAMRGDSDAVIRMLDRLADVLRTTLERTDPEVPLELELDLIERYLDIERVRYGERLVTAEQVSSRARSALVPNLILQPLVENAVRHGISETTGALSIAVGASVEHGRTRLWVRDNGPGFDEGDRRGGGIGLANTRERLAALYGEDARLELVERPEGGGAFVEIELPYRQATPPHAEPTTALRVVG